MSQVFRWTPFLPAAALSAALIQMPVTLVGLVLDLLPAIFDSIILDLLSEGMASRLVGPFVSGLVFVYVGDRVAPRWHLYAASGLVLIWTLGSGMVFMYSLPRAGTYNSGWVELLSAVLLESWVHAWDCGDSAGSFNTSIIKTARKIIKKFAHSTYNTIEGVRGGVGFLPLCRS